MGRKLVPCVFSGALAPKSTGDQSPSLGAGSARTDGARLPRAELQGVGAALAAAARSGARVDPVSIPFGSGTPAML